MISRRNYFTITVIMAVVFFLFQFINVALETWNVFEINPYVIDKETLPGREDALGAGQEAAGRQNAQGTESSFQDNLVYIGNEAEAIGGVVRAWATYTRRELYTYGSLWQYEAEKEGGRPLPEMMILDTANMDWDQTQELDRLEEYVKEGINLVFCNLPDASIIEGNSRLQQFLGIREIRAAETTVAGIHLYKGFLFGGETIYQAQDEEENEKRQDMELTLPWYILGSGTKAYMKGIPEDETVQLEERPGIIWRRSFGKAQWGCLFAVNGGYMEDVTGLGLLSAMMTETKYYEIYPVINAQNMIVANYPGLSSENEEEMERLYGQPMEGVFRDIVWPDLISIYQQNKLGLSCMVAPQFDYQDDRFPEPKQLVHYMKLLNEQKAEAGLSCISVSDTPLDQKLSEDRRFMEEALPEYRFTSLYTGNMAQEEVDAVLQEEWLSAVRTVVTDYTGDNEIIGFASEDVTKQSILTDGFKYTYREDFRLRSVETALGYSSVLVDMNEVAYSGEGNETWKDISHDFKWNTKFYLKPFRNFAGTTASQCDERIRNFYTLKYTENRSGERIDLKVSDLRGPAWFILRTKDEEIVSMEGGSWQRLEDNIYLLTVENEMVSLNMKPDRYVYIFE